MSADRYNELSHAQRAFLETLDDEKIRSLSSAADLITNMDPDTYYFLMSNPKNVVDFLRNAEPETLKWLEKADKKKLHKVDDAIQFMSNAAFMGRWSWIGMSIIASMTLAVYWVFHVIKGDLK